MFRENDCIYEIVYNDKEQISIYITIFNGKEALKSKRIVILLYKRFYIVFTQLYTEVQIVKELLKNRFNIVSDIRDFTNKEYIRFVTQYKINSMYVLKNDKIINIKIKKNREIIRHIENLYSTVFILKCKDVSYIINMPKFGLFHIGTQKREDIINILEGLKIA
ncbi:MAG: hypothetical protein HFJ29_04115 [Clostridia bacterium]|nr:hypothetical protein [Clostridia bacterium]